MSNDPIGRPPIKFTITDGPALGQLVDCFKYAFSPKPSQKLNVTFSGCFDGRPHPLEGKGQSQLDAKVVGLEYEDEHHGDFVITVLIFGYLRSRGRYNAKLRSGSINLLPQF